MFYLWYCFDDHLAAWLDLPRISDIGLTGFIVLTLLHLALLPFFAVNWHLIAPAFDRFRRALTPAAIVLIAALSLIIILIALAAHSASLPSCD